MINHNLFALALFICLGCKNPGKKEETKEVKFDTKYCLTKRDREKAIEAILSTNDFQMFLHPEVEGRLPIKLVKNEFITPNMKIMSNGFKVGFCDSLTLPDGKEHRIRIRDVDCGTLKISYSVFYPIEGAVITGIVKKTDSIWITSETTWGEKD